MAEQVAAIAFTLRRRNGGEIDRAAHGIGRKDIERSPLVLADVDLEWGGGIVVDQAGDLWREWLD